MKPFNTILNFGAMLVTFAALTTISPSTVLAAGVTVINPDTQPVPVKHVLPLPGMNYAFQSDFYFSMSAGSVDFMSQAFYTPQGMRLVIEHMSIRALVENGHDENLSYGARVTNPKAEGSHSLTMPAGTTDDKLFVSSGLPGSANWAFGATPIRLYVGAGAPMNVWVHRSNATGISNGWVAVTGHFEPAP
jgi:hypothetical protein